MRYYDPHVLDKFPSATAPWDFDPDEDYLILSGGPMTPATHHAAAHGLAPCPSCGCYRDERLYRRQSAWIARRGVYGPQVGRVLCLGCDKGSLDGLVPYPGRPIGESIDPDYPVDQPAYQPTDDGLAGGRGGETKMTRKVKRAKARAKA